MPSNKELIRRAHKAWLGYAPDQSTEPTWAATTVEEHAGLTYVVLRRAGRVIDVFRYIPTEGQLRLLRNNWPGDYGRKRDQRASYAAA